MKKLTLKIVSILFCFAATTMIANASNSEFCSAEKLYILPEQLAITANGIFVEFNEHWYETSALFSDEAGLYVQAPSPTRRDCGQYEVHCRNCSRCVNEAYDMCPYCGKPTLH
jgi:hypothetical protein